MRNNIFTKRLTPVIIIGSIIIFIINIIIVVNLRSANKNVVSIYNDRVVCLKQLKTISDNYNIQVTNLIKNAINSHVDQGQAINILKQASIIVSKNWSDYLQTYLTEEEKKEAMLADQSIKDANEMIGKIVNILKSDDTVRNKTLIENLFRNKLYPKIDEITSQLNILVDIQVKEAAKLEQSSKNIFSKTIYQLIIAGLTFFAILILVFNRTHLLQSLKEKTRELALSNEDLKTANENLFTANEELEATNEEFFTTNEELITVNEELNDLRNNLESIIQQRTKENLELSFLFEELILNTTDGIFFLNVTPENKFKLTRVNPVIENELKIYNQVLAGGKLIDELFNPEESAYFNGRYSHCLNLGKPVNYEEFININNQNTYWSTTLIPIKNKSCVIESIVGVARIITKEKEIEKALRESEYKYKSLFDKMMDAFVLYEPIFDDYGKLIDFRYLEVNPAYNAQSYVSSEESLGKTFKEVHSSSTSDTLNNYIEVFETGNSKSFESYNNYYDKYYIVNTYKPTENRLVTIFQDITTKRKAELMLASTNASLQAIINYSPAAIIDTDVDGKIKSVWNHAAERIFGWTREEVLGKFMPYVSKSNLPESNDIRKRVIHGESFSNIELRRQKKDGTNIYINLATAPIYNNEHEIDSTLLIINDITEKKKLESDLIASESTFKNLFNLSFDGIVIDDKDLNIIEVNQSYMDLTGYSKEDFLSNIDLKLIRSKYMTLLDSRRRDLLNGKELGFIEVEMNNKDNKILTVAMNSRIIELNGQKCFMTVSRDITAQKQMQKRIYEAIIQIEENERRKLAGDLHDEIGPQLASMRMYTSSLMRGKADEYTKNIHNILMELIMKSINDIRDISHNLSPVTLQRYGLVNAINTECEMVSLIMPVKFVHNIKYQRFSNTIEIVIYRIVKELLNNTKKHTKADNIQITLNLSTDLLTLEYSDNGQGFSYEEILKSENKGMGLMNIEMRVKSINGTSKFSNTAEGGLYFNLQVQV